MAEGGKRTRVLIAGGGVAALEATLALRALADGLVDIELVAPEDDFVYRPLAVAEPFLVGEVRRFPLRRLTEAAGASLRRGIVTGVEPSRRVVQTAEGEEIHYDALLLALGARPVEAVPGAVSFRGPADGPALSNLLEEALDGEIQRIVFAVPAGVTWPLPLYELALLTETFLIDRGAMNVDIGLVTPEEAPLALFGTAASAAIGELLEAREIELRTHSTPLGFENGILHVKPAATIEADRVVALPRLAGPALDGIPSDANGFVPTDEHGRVGSEIDVYAAGDLTQFPLKQGGIAAQQADTAAASIAVQAGAKIEPEPFRPVLRGLLLTGTVPRYLRAEAGTARSEVDTEPLWWPPAKIVGRHLAPFLAERLGLPDEPPAAGREAVAVEVPL
jgi:sulfide:quinone oxidoreductase